MTQGQANAQFAIWRARAPSDMESFDGRPVILNQRATEALRHAPGRQMDNKYFICSDDGIQMIVIYPGIGRD